MSWTKQGRAYETSNPADIAAMQEAVRLDIEAHGCDPKAFGPSHARVMTVTFPDQSKKALTYQCQSGCRFYNPETGKMEGRAHCTCDGCF